MVYKWGNAAECRHSKGRNLPKIGKDTLAVYATCKNLGKLQCYKHYYLDSHLICDSCDHFKAKN